MAHRNESAGHSVAPGSATTAGTLTSLSLRAGLIGRVLVVRVAGLVTLQAYLASHRAIAAEVDQYRPRTVLVDFTRATLAISPGEWRFAAEPCAWAEADVALPVAYVVAKTSTLCLRRYCASMAAHGRLRTARTTERPAFAWCQWYADDLTLPVRGGRA